MKRQEFHLIARGGVEWLECDTLSRLPWLRHAFSTRILHPNSQQPRVEGRKSQTENSSTFDDRLLESFETPGISPYRLLFDRLGVRTLKLAGLQQIHSSSVYQVRSEGSGLRYNPSGCGPADAGREGRLPSGDALLTDQPGILLSVRTADCLPILLVDPARRAVAAVHAGWRGLLQRIAEKTVGEMRRAFHSRPEKLWAALGPSIRVCCYEVGQEVVDTFRGRFTLSEGCFKERPAEDAALASRHGYWFLSARVPGHSPDGAAAAHLDLVAVTRDQLQSGGLRSGNIYVADFCTACRTDLFFSHRKEGTTGRMMAVIGMV